MYPAENSPRIGLFAFVAIPIISIFNVGCDTTIINYRTHPELIQRIGHKEDFVSAPANIKIKQLGAGGVPEEIDEYSEECTRLFATSLEKLTSPNGQTNWRAVESRPDIKDDFDEITALSEIVLQDIMRFSYHDMYPGFEHKRKDFRYSVGDISSVLEKTGGDAMLIFSGTDYYTTSGRKAVNTLLTVLSAAATGEAYIGTESNGIVFAMLVDSDGEVLWITHFSDLKMDLRMPEQIDSVTKTILQDLNKAVSRDIGT